MSARSCLSAPERACAVSQSQETLLRMRGAETGITFTPSKGSAWMARTRTRCPRSRRCSARARLNFSAPPFGANRRTTMEICKILTNSSIRCHAPRTWKVHICKLRNPCEGFKQKGASGFKGRGERQWVNVLHPCREKDGVGRPIRPSTGRGTVASWVEFPAGQWWNALPLSPP